MTVDAHFGFDMAHPSSRPEVKSASSGWKAFMFTIFKHANHWLTSIFRLARWLVIILTAVLEIIWGTQPMDDGWTPGQHWRVKGRDHFGHRSFTFLFNKLYPQNNLYTWGPWMVKGALVPWPVRFCWLEHCPLSKRLWVWFLIKVHT